MAGGIAAWAARHAHVVLVVAAVAALAAGLIATRLPTDAGTDTLVDSDTPAYLATEEVREAFGEEPIVVLARGDLPELVLGENLFRLLRLEGCLSGRVPKGVEPIPGPCAELARMRPVQFLAGPATFLNQAVVQVDRQLRRLAASLPPERLREFLLSVAARYGITSLPTFGNPEFTAHVVFDLRKPRGTPKARLAYLFPNSRSAQILVRLRSDLDQGERHRAIELIRAAVFDETPRPACSSGRQPLPCFALEDGEYVVSGVPAVVDGVARYLKEALLVLFAVALVVMGLTLLLVFRSSMRLLPLALALAAAAVTFGALGALGGSLTMASIAVLPILIGLGVDYAIQFQARFDEARREGAGAVEGARMAAARGAPAIGAACLATTAGFLALQLSPTPMVREFGLLLVAGVAIAFALALTAGFAALALRRRPPAPRREWRLRPPRVATTRPRRVLAVGLSLAVLGWAAGTQVSTDTDIRSLAPQDVDAVQALEELEDTTGVSGQLDVRVRAADLADPALIRWMSAFKERVLRAGGFAGADASCRTAEICPGPALSDFLGGGRLSRAGVREAIATLSPYALAQVAPVDPRTGRLGRTALVSFGIRAQSLEDQRRLIERIRDLVGRPGTPQGPPPGTSVELAGLPVIAAESAADLSESRHWLTIAGILAVALALLLVRRPARRALPPLVPTVLATGWSALVLWVSGIPLNPMSAALGALTIAIATEFSVLLAARYEEERRAGSDPDRALRLAYERTGGAVLASGATAIAGFAVLIASDVAMLRDFGLVTVVDLSVALLGVVVVLPAALLLVEERR